MLKNKKLIIYGAGETAEIIADYFIHDSEYEVVGFCVDREYKMTQELNQLPVFEFETISDTHPPSEFAMFAAASFGDLNRLRQSMYDKVKALGYYMPSYISSKAFIWHNAKVGENSFVFENNVIQYKVKIGNNCILWSGNHIGHQTIIQDNCFISSHVVISGFCNIGTHCFLGVNSSINDEVTIGNDCVTGNGTIITKDLPENGIYVGSPAKRIKHSKETFKIQ